MGLFKNVFKGAAEKLKDSLEESGINVRDRLDDMRNGLDGIKQKATNANNTISSADTSEDDNKDEGIKIPVGTLTNGVLEIDEGFSELDSESLEEYKHLRKIIMPASLEQLDSDVINDMKELKEVDFSKVTRLKEIPEEFIYGETSIVRFIIPQGVKEVGNGFLGDTQTIKEVYVPSTVKSLGYITGQSENNIDVYLFAPDTDIDEVQEDIKNLYVLPQYFGSYARKLKKCGSEASLREIPNDKKNIYPEEMPIAIETTTEEPPADVSLGNPQEIKSKGAGVFSPRLEALIDAALQDGVLTDKERLMIKSRAEKEGEDWDEVEMIIEARLAEMQPEVTIAQTPQALNQPATPVPQKETKDQINELLEFRRKKLVDLRIVQDEKEKHKTPENVNRWEQIIREIQGIDATIKNLRKAAEEKAAAEKTVSPPPIPVPPTPPVSTKKVSVPPPIPIGEVKNIVQDSPYLIVNGKKYKSVSIDKIDRDTLEDITGLDGEEIISVTIPTGVKRIKEYAFSHCRNLKELVIPNSVEDLEEDAFGSRPCDMSYEKLRINCPIIPDNVFNGAPLKEVILGEGVKEINNYTFAYCEYLKTIILPSSIEYIGYGAFQNCTSLSEIDFSKCVNLEIYRSDAHSGSPIRILDFSNCKSLDLDWLAATNNLEKVILPPGQESFNRLFFWDKINVDVSCCKELKQIVEECFKKMNIKEIVIPDTVETIGKNAFDECTELKTIVMPAALKEIHATLGGEMYELKKVDFSKVTQLKKIPPYLFKWGCYKLKELVIPQGVVEIKHDAFVNLERLKRLFLPPSLTTIEDLGCWHFSIYCFSPSLEELEPIVYGWDDDDDDDDEDDDLYDDECDKDDLDELDEEEKEEPRIRLYVLPQYLDSYIAQRNAERIPKSVLSIKTIPDEYLYYYDN